MTWTTATPSPIIWNRRGAERQARGITITSAAITFDWRGHRINLIDTPGHVDFSMEVERCLRVLDGAVAVLDASAGVEAQTLTVWRQADRYAVPRIVYLNKMDKRTADVQLCLDSIVRKFGIKPLLTNLPLRISRFAGVLDLLTMEKVVWLDRPEDSGRTFQRTKLEAAVDGELWERTTLARIQLTEDLADLDDRMADIVLTAAEDNSETAAAEVDESELRNALRRVTLERKAVPVLCGSSHTNVGVQLLLDAIVDYLPSPEDIGRSLAQDQTYALVFKILHDKQMGRLAFTRIYTGSIQQGQKIYDVNRQTTERPTKLLRAFADEFRPISMAEAGDIVVLAGTKNVVTGDTLVLSGDSTTAVPLEGIRVPPPVFFCSIEAASLAHQKPMEAALEQLRVEDPSLGVRIDADTGQRIISGLGELHIEILKDRLLKEYKVQAYFGELQVAYKEVVVEVPTDPLEHVYDKVLGSSRQRVLLKMSLDTGRPSDHQTGLIRMARVKENQENLAKIRPEHLTSLESGVRSALSVGPVIGFPVSSDDLSISLHWLQVAGNRATLSATVSAVASQCVSRLLQLSDVRLSEPLMLLEIVLPVEAEERDGRLHGILGDLSSRRGRILDVHDRSDAKVVRALVPLAEIVGYSTVLRTITSGKATFTIEFHSYSLMNERDQRVAIDRTKGFL